MRILNVGGVPEHFNLPWHLCMEQGEFEKEGLEINWRNFPDGTGAMNKALREGEIDVAIILTEGIVKDIIAGNPSKIVQTFVASPLIWGIHVDYNSSINSLEQLKDQTVAVSRMGSGSHLMACVNAEQQQWNPEDLHYKIVGDIDGAVEALQNNEAQYFMWEHFTTKPLVDRKIFRRIADCPTPWPCFVIAVREEILENNEEEIIKMLQVINLKTTQFKKIPHIAETLAKRYDQQPADIKKWLEITSWSQSQLTDDQLQNVQEKLFELNLIPDKVPNTSLIKNL